jgi:hypothetical protein
MSAISIKKGSFAITALSLFLFFPTTAAPLLLLKTEFASYTTTT